MKPKEKVIIAFILFFIFAATLIGISYYGEQKETIEFDDFTLEVPAGSEFFKMNTTDNIIKEAYRCRDKDLTISIMNKDYIENTYYSNTGERIDFGEMLLKHFNSNTNYNVNKTSEHLTMYSAVTRFAGHSDTDVAGIYTDNDHIIIIEGGDIELITDISKSINITK